MNNAAAPLLLDFRRVTIMRGAATALNDISLEIPLGQNVAILGPNGSGKSSLIKAITRECYPLANEGTYVKILGRETWDVFELRKHLGIVAGDTLAHNPSIRCGEAVLSGFFATFSLWRNSSVTDEMREEATLAMQAMGISHLSERRVSELSSGEARRVIIARALVHRPHSLLLDEPMENLDIQAALSLKKQLKEIAAGGSQIILVTHNIADIIPEIDRVIMLNKGRVVADGSRNETLTSEKLSALFDMELKVIEERGFFHLI